MKLAEQLLEIAQRSRPTDHALLETAAQLLVDQQLWRSAWIDAEKRVDLLINELSMLKLSCKSRKEKDPDE